jgi:hypothetical protein
MDNVYFQPTNPGVYKYGRRRFLRRQFDDVPTQAQFNFDVAFGLVIPVLCFVFDPIVFRGGFLHEGGAFQSVRLFAYAASAIEIATFACWLFVVRSFPAWSRPAGGVLAAGAFFSFALGFAILPLSIIGLLFVGVGALGFIPFVTGIVYLRNARRALRLNRKSGPVRGGALVSFAFGLFVALALPAATQRGATRVVRSAGAEILAGGEPSPRRMRMARALTRVTGETFDDMAEEYSRQTDPERKARLAHAYEELKGEDISNNRRMILDD